MAWLYADGMDRFTDRREAGRELAESLQQYAGEAVVFALPRGGVETAVEVAHELDAPLGLLVARKIGHPSNPEYAVCAVTETGPLVCDDVELANLDPLWLSQAEQSGRAEAKRRRELYLADRSTVSARDRVAIVVDDGIATGLSMRAAVADLQKQRPSRLIVAVPVAPRDAVHELLDLADEVVVLKGGGYLGSVGAYYDSFPQLTDEDVIDLLDEVT